MSSVAAAAPKLPIASSGDIDKVKDSVDDKGYHLIKGICSIPAFLRESFDALKGLYDRLKPTTYVGVDKSYTTVRGSLTGTLAHRDGHFKVLKSKSSDTFGEAPMFEEAASNEFLQELIRTSLKMIPGSSGECYRREVNIGVSLACHTTPTPKDLGQHFDPGTYLFTYFVENTLEGGKVQIFPSRSSYPEVEEAVTRPLDGYLINQMPSQGFMGGRLVQLPPIMHAATRITSADPLKVDVQEDGSVKLDYNPFPARKIIVLQIDVLPDRRE